MTRQRDALPPKVYYFRMTAAHSELVERWSEQEKRPLSQMLRVLFEKFIDQEEKVRAQDSRREVDVDDNIRS